MLVALALTLLAVLAAWQAWRSDHRRLLWGSVLLAILATVAWCQRYGVEIGVPLAIESASLIALGFILSRTERRPDRVLRERRVSAPARPPGWRSRGGGRALLAGPLAFIATMGIAIAFAVRAPLHEQTRLILAGLLVPSLWAIAMLLALGSRRPARIAGSFVVMGAGGFALALTGHA